MHCFAFLFAISTACASAQLPEGANCLTEAERQQGWNLLFDGVNLPTNAFVGVKCAFREFPSKGWRVDGGALTVLPNLEITPEGKTKPLPDPVRALGGGGDIVTRERYGDFEFSFDFRLTRAANSGVKYFYDETRHGGTCEEYQILDPAHPDSKNGRDGNRRVASLYDIYPARADQLLFALGKWNHGRILSRGNHVEHWINGKCVLSYERGSAAFRESVAKSKYIKCQDSKGPWGETPVGRVMLQDHNDSTVSFCNLKIRRLSK